MDRSPEDLQPPPAEDDLRYYASYAQEIMRIISFFETVPSSLRFLDFAMGWGKWALMVKAFGCNSYGTELSVSRIKYARSTGLDVITQDEIPLHRFDVINAEKVFEHISEPLETLCRLKEGLKANGILRIQVPAARDMHRRLRVMDWSAPKGSKSSLNPVAPLEHINYFRRSSLARMAREAGMVEISIPIQARYKFTTEWDEKSGNVGEASSCVFLRRKS